MLKNDLIETMKSHAAQVVASYGVRDRTLYARYKEMYFMTDENKKPNNATIDENDWAITVSPSSRNEVQGMVRLLDTSEIHVTAKSKGEDISDSNKIERALKDMLRVSGEYRRARIESDAALSAVLYSPVVLYSESVDDLLEVHKDKYKRKQLEQIRRRTPFLIRSINPEQSYPEWGEFGLISHTWKYKIRGSILKERWGVKDCRPDTEYTVYDIYDCENRLVYADGINDVLFADKHGLSTIPVVCRYAGGSSLFFEPEKQMGSFLYGKALSRLDKRENALLTAIATAINMRGLMGPLLAIDPDKMPLDQKVIMDYTGGVRYIIAKAQQVDDKIIDPVVFQWRQLLKEMSGESTIHQQTLGTTVNTGTFSGMAMLSSAGKLPLVDSQRAIEMAFRDVFLNVLQRIKEEGIANDLVQPSEIPDDIDIEVTLEPNLPQDKLRNAQVAQSLGDLVSDEWKHTNLLQIGDSAEMRKQSMKEQVFKAIIAGIVRSPEIMQGMIKAAVGQGANQASVNGQMPADGGQMPADGGQIPPEMQGQEMMPLTDPMLTADERGMG